MPRPLLSLCVTTYNDAEGCWQTLQSIRLQAEPFRDQIQIVVLDNSPADSPHRAPIAGLVQKLPQEQPDWQHRYLPAPELQGTSQTRHACIAAAEGEWFLHLDSHVLLHPLALHSLFAWIAAHPQSTSLVQGPLLYDDADPRNMVDHFSDVWGCGMRGRWARSPQLVSPYAPPFEIGAQGLGLFAMRKAVWPGLLTEGNSFGGEEWHLHERLRLRGQTTLCLPGLLWLHRFFKTANGNYPHSREGQFRQTLLYALWSGSSLERLYQHWVSREVPSVTGDPRTDLVTHLRDEHCLSEAQAKFGTLEQLQLYHANVTIAEHQFRNTLSQSLPRIAARADADLLQGRGYFEQIRRDWLSGTTVSPPVVSAPLDLVSAAGVVEAKAAPYTPSLAEMLASAVYYQTEQLPVVAGVTAAKPDSVPASDPAARPVTGCGACQKALDLPLEDRYAALIGRASDISEHLPTLRRLAEECDTVVEFGVRTGESTTALLAGLADRDGTTLIATDLNDSPQARGLAAVAGKCQFSFQRGDSLQVEPQACDLLFIDTLHTGPQLAAELERHAPLCRRWIVLHDTETFGEQGELGQPGLMPAVRTFLKAHLSQWVVAKHYTNNNGLLVLSCDPRERQALPPLASQVWNYLGSTWRRWMNGNELVSEAIAEQRLDRCVTCTSRAGDRCGKCGCYLVEVPPGQPVPAGPG